MRLVDSAGVEIISDAPTTEGKALSFYVFATVVVTPDEKDMLLETLVPLKQQQVVERFLEIIQSSSFGAKVAELQGQLRGEK